MSGKSAASIVNVIVSECACDRARYRQKENGSTRFLQNISNGSHAVSHQAHSTFCFTR
jgi:hypothetical protein